MIKGEQNIWILKINVKTLQFLYNTFGFSNLREASEKEVGWKNKKKQTRILDAYE